MEFWTLVLQCWTKTNYICRISGWCYGYGSVTLYLCKSLWHKIVPESVILEFLNTTLVSNLNSTWPSPVTWKLRAFIVVSCCCLWECNCSRQDGNNYICVVRENRTCFVVILNHVEFVDIIVNITRSIIWSLNTMNSFEATTWIPFLMTFDELVLNLDWNNCHLWWLDCFHFTISQDKSWSL